MTWRSVALGLATVAGCAAEQDRASPSTPAQRASATSASAIEASLFAPNDVLAHADDIDLESSVRTAIAADLAGAQADWDALRARLGRETNALETELARPTIDEARAASAAVAVMDTENEIRAKHLALLVRLKNRLSVAQQERLRAL